MRSNEIEDVLVVVEVGVVNSRADADRYIELHTVLRGIPEISPRDSMVIKSRTDLQQVPANSVSLSAYIRLNPFTYAVFTWCVI